MLPSENKKCTWMLSTWNVNWAVRLLSVILLVFFGDGTLCLGREECNVCKPNIVVMCMHAFCSVDCHAILVCTLLVMTNNNPVDILKSHNITDSLKNDSLKKSYPYPSNPMESRICQSFVLQAIQRVEFANVYCFLLYGNFKLAHKVSHIITRYTHTCNEV